MAASITGLIVASACWRRFTKDLVFCRTTMLDKGMSYFNRGGAVIYRFLLWRMRLLRGCFRLILSIVMEPFTVWPSWVLQVILFTYPMMSCYILGQISRPGICLGAFRSNFAGLNLHEWHNSGVRYPRNKALLTLLLISLLQYKA